MFRSSARSASALRFPLVKAIRGPLAAVAVTAALLVGMTALPQSARADIDLHLESPVVKTLMAQNWDDLKRMLMSGTNTATTDQSKQPLIVLAARNGMTPAVEILLQHQARVDLTDSFGNTALMWAADQNYTDIMKLLIDAGANINFQNRQGITALMRTAEKGSTSAADLLLRKGADTQITDYTGRDALSWAEASGNGKIIRLLEKAR